MRSILALFVVLAGCSSEDLPADCDALVDDASDAQGALIDADAGDTICFEGTLALTSELSLTVDGVTLRGLDGATLDFSGQTTGANGLHVDSVAGITVEDLTILNPAGDGVRVTASDDVIFRRTKVIWDAAEPTDANGAYGIYPVMCHRVLIEDCEVQGAADAGIYVGQSEDVLVRNNTASKNVAAIEIENTDRAEVIGNEAFDNTSGILVFDLPGLPAGNGAHARVADNDVHENNRDNFATAGTIVSYVPPGVGLMVLAKDFVEITANTVRDQTSTGVLVVSYDVVATLGAGAANDPMYDSIPEAIYIHANTFENIGAMPAGALAILGSNLPDVVWDGIVDTTRTDPDARRICVRDATLVNGDFEHGFSNPSMDLAPHDCEHEPEAHVCIFGACD